jgi:hypothetical protein
MCVCFWGGGGVGGGWGGVRPLKRPTKNFLQDHPKNKTQAFEVQGGKQYLAHPPHTNSFFLTAFLKEY